MTSDYLDRLLADVATRIESNLDSSPDVLVLNKFGKAECDGGGLIELIANAMDRNRSA